VGGECKSRDRMRGPRFWLWALAVTLAAGAAQGGDRSVRLEYHAPAGCPSDAAFRSEVERRLDHARLAERSELARTYRIELTADDDRFVAHLELTDADGARASRELTAPTCDEAARAMALVAALAIEERVVKEEQAQRAKPPPAPAPTPSPEPPPRRFAPRAAPPQPPASGTRFGVVAAVGAEHGFAPRTAPRVSAAFEASFGQSALRAGVAWASTGPVDVDGGSATFALYVLSLEGCPWRLRLSEAVALVPCAGLDGGFVHAAGRKSARIVAPSAVTKPWLVPRAIGRVELAPDPNLAFELQGALGAPLTRPEFTLEKPEFTVHSVPAVSWGAAVGVVGRF
jgi:hypothetical protein